MAELLAAPGRWKEIRSEGWSYAERCTLRATRYAGFQMLLFHSAIVCSQILRISCGFQRFLHVLQATHSYFCIPRNFRSIWCTRTEKFYRAVVRHSLELRSFQKKLDGLTVHACINDTALAYYSQGFQKALDLQHILCNIDLHMYSQLDLSRGVELTEYLQTVREVFAASQKHWIYCAYIMRCTCPYFLCGNTWAELWEQ